MYSTEIGGISWVDLTVDNAQKVRDFYSAVVGLKPEALSIGEYDDYIMKSPQNEDAQVGICHARGQNANLPPQWLIYFNVADLDVAIQQCLKLGGKVISPPANLGEAHMCVIQDVAGAIAALVAKK